MLSNTDLFNTHVLQSTNAASLKRRKQVVGIPIHLNVIKNITYLVVYFTGIELGILLIRAL